jgi:hypothetical protein
MSGLFGFNNYTLEKKAYSVMLHFAGLSPITGYRIRLLPLGFLGELGGLRGGVCVWG